MNSSNALWRIRRFHTVRLEEGLRQTVEHNILCLKELTHAKPDSTQSPQIRTANNVEIVPHRAEVEDVQDEIIEAVPESVADEILSELAPVKLFSVFFGCFEGVVEVAVVYMRADAACWYIKAESEQFNHIFLNA